jgi:hypothetical protein
MWPFEQRRALGRLRPGPPRRELQLLVSPPIWRVWVDGRAVSRTPGMPRSVHVGRGRHVVEFRHPRTFPLRFEVPAGSADRSLGGRLRWRPATLTVRVRPARAARRAAFRYLAPRFLEGRSTQPVNLPLTIRLGRRVRTRPRARIQIFARGYRHEERRVVLTPGARRTVSVRLRSLTPSRR